ncbi:type IV secretion system protein [Sphingobium subterraneum]|uniref:Type IV secretion system protein VirB6 n=1 Tax=Sphingobium subterraneum TaxID=627688 RepID=A0A841J128_9SPHN|nr:type IV secretion system protein [Sphingobium subterraneum]MBB6124889.1 type IV secretion system protein VirB6 [Sphingobium subterraneum]
MSTCDTLTANASAGAAPALRAVDCLANEAAASAFGRLFGAAGAMGPALTILLTLYIVFFALSLLTGRSRIGISALTPRMLTLGLVLTFATSWAAYQGVVWNLATGAPDQLAGAMTGVSGPATQMFADKLDIIFAAIEQASDQARNNAPVVADASAAVVTARVAAQGTFSPDNLIWLAAVLLLLGTVGLLVTARIALAVLLAVGPVFVVLALFDGTRGLFVGWLRGAVMTAMVPLFVVVGGGISLELMVPVIGNLAGDTGIDARAAMALFLIASVHMALMGMVMKVAGSMVAAWQVFGLAPAIGEQGREGTSGHDRSAPAALSGPQPMASPSLSRRTLIAAPAVMPTGGPESGVISTRSTRTVIAATPPISATLPSTPARRARGIGSRFAAQPYRSREMMR